MPLPEEFNRWEHLQGVIKQLHNRQLREYFRDIGDTTESLLPPRASLKLACEIHDHDTAPMALLRLFLYFFILRQGQDFFPYYGMPIYDVQAIRKFRPQIQLFFSEDRIDVEPGYQPITGEISFRLMDKSSENLTETELTRLATKIKTEFGSAKGFIWRKGRKLAAYTEPERGYGLKLFVRNETDARELISKILDIQGHTPNWENFNFSENQAEGTAFPIVPPRKQILGEQRRLPRRRPTAEVRYRYAIAHVWGVGVPIPLHDLSLRFKRPLVAA